MNAKRSGLVAAAVLSLAGLSVVGGGAWALMLLLRSPAPAGPGAPAPNEHGALGVAENGQEIRGVDAALDAARAYIDHERAGVAQSLLESTVERFPGDQRVHLLLGEALLAQDEKEQAYRRYDQAIAIGPDHAEYRHAAATIASELGLLEEAQTHYMVAQKLAPGNPKFPLYLAQVQRKLGKADEARANLVLAARLDPELAIAWASLGAIALDENRLEVARGYIEKARAIEPQRTEWRVMQARVLRRSGKPREAIELLLALPQAQRTADASLIDELALSYGLLGEPAEAAALYAAALGADFLNDAQIGKWSYEAAVWLERAGQRDRAATFARHALAAGFKDAAALVERLEGPPR